MLRNSRSAWQRTSIIVSLSFTVFFFGSTLVGRPRTLPDQTVTTPEGNVRVTNLSCNHGVGFLFVKGKIINETGKSWDTLYLAMQVRDKNGIVKPKGGPGALILMHDPQASAGIILKEFGIGTTLKLNYQEESPKTDSETCSITFTYADGSYPVHYRAALTKPAAANNLEFHDNALAVTFSLQKTELDFVLQNNSNDPIKIDWNLVSFVWGTSHGVIHKGVKFADKEKTKPPSLIPPSAKIEDMILPVENVEFVGGDWLTRPLFLEGPAAQRLVGQEFSIFVPLDIGGIVKNYTFAFKIVAVD